MGWKANNKNCVRQPNSVNFIETVRETRRCAVTYKLAIGCKEMRLFCVSPFYLPNKDAYLCRKGDKMLVKSSGGKPRVFCDKMKPTRNFPVLSSEGLKVWITMHPSTMYPNKGAKCIVICDNPSD